MGLSFARAMLKQKISLADINPAAREAALQNGAAIAYDHVEPEAAKRILKEIEAALMRSSTLPVARNPWHSRFRSSRAAARSWSLD